MVYVGIVLLSIFHEIGCVVARLPAARAATLPMLPKHLRSLPSFSFLSEVDASLLIRESCLGPEFTYGEVIITQVCSVFPESSGRCTTLRL